MDYFKITKRCIRCRKPLRADGTCQNVKCVRYKPEPEQEKKETETYKAQVKSIDNQIVLAMADGDSSLVEELKEEKGNALSEYQKKLEALNK